MTPSSVLAPADALDAWSRRSHAANGFGDADAALAALPGPPAAVERQRVTLARPSYRLAEVTVGATASLVAAVRDAWQRWQRRRDVRAACRTLAELDARTLRDIGIARSECGSLAAELGGVSEPTRVRVLLAQRERAF